MDIVDLHPPDDYSHRFFIWHEWLQALAEFISLLKFQVNGPLTTENVFEYFATSMFYDKQSNNQVLRMQTMHTGQSIENEAEELRRFTGIEFSLVHSQPPSFFVIQKRERLSPDEVIPLASYFIMNNRIYQAPDLYTVLSNRLLTSLHSLQASLDTLRKYRPDYTPRTGFAWPIVDPSVSEEKKKTEDEEASSISDAETTTEIPARKDNKRRQQNNLLLLNAMRTTAAHMKTLPPSNNLSSAAEGPVPSSTVLSTRPLSPSTPAPTSSRGATPHPSLGASAPAAEGQKAQTHARKKKKRKLPTAPGASCSRFLFFSCRKLTCATSWILIIFEHNTGIYFAKNTDSLLNAEASFVLFPHNC
ncbi:MED6-domain-containing protein [Amanita rubescens]|nr:MED6-domain-containing protein [Amanita rubescens]